MSGIPKREPRYWGTDKNRHHEDCLSLMRIFLYRLALFFIKCSFAFGLFFVNLSSYFSNKIKASIYRNEAGSISETQTVPKTRTITLTLDARQSELLDQAIEFFKKEYTKNTGKVPGKNYYHDAVVDLIARGIVATTDTTPRFNLNHIINKWSLN